MTARGLSEWVCNHTLCAMDPPYSPDLLRKTPRCTQKGEARSINVSLSRAFHSLLFRAEEPQQSYSPIEGTSSEWVKRFRSARQACDLGSGWYPFMTIKVPRVGRNVLSSIQFRPIGPAIDSKFSSQVQRSFRMQNITMITGYAKSFLDYRMKLFRESRGHKIHRTQRSKTIFQINEKITHTAQPRTIKVQINLPIRGAGVSKSSGLIGETPPWTKVHFYP